MPDLTFYDASAPPADPPSTDGVCIYIGGDTPHVWTPAEIDRQKARYRLPIFVRSNPAGASAARDVKAAVAQLQVIGAPKGCLVAWDTETAADVPYMSAVYLYLRAAGYQLIDYGSQSSVFGNLVPDGYYWGADWTGTARIDTGDKMTQYASFKDYDLSLAIPSLPFWDTRRPAGTVSSPITNWTENIVHELPTIAQGATGTAVRTAQALCNARGFTTAVDGIYGPETKWAVEQVQQQGRISVDGIAGPQTWPVLMGVA